MPRALLASVGGSPEPILFSLRHHRPDVVWFFCSEDSRPQAEDVYLQLVREATDWRLSPEYILVERFEELGPCYEKLRAAIPGLLTKWKVAPENVIVDYTGGTKTMSAALVLAAVERLDQFSYIGGKQREKGGLGVTINNQERVQYQANPWTSLAVREIERARDLWASFQFEAAAEVLLKVAARLAQPLLFKTVANIANGLAARHRLDFTMATRFLGEASQPIPGLFDGKAAFGLDQLARDTHRLCQACKPGAADPETLLGELLDNTLRTASQNRFEDAAARLYRCMEMQIQIWLFEKTGGLFKDGISTKSPEELPPELQYVGLQAHPHGGIKLALEAGINYLHALGDDRVAHLIEDLSQKNPRLRNATKNRNKGILAHGTEAIGEKGFLEFKSIAQELFGFDLERERNPIPPLDPRWLQLHPCA